MEVAAAPGEPWVLSPRAMWAGSAIPILAAAGDLSALVGGGGGGGGGGEGGGLCLGLWSPPAEQALRYYYLACSQDLGPDVSAVVRKL